MDYLPETELEKPCEPTEEEQVVLNVRFFIDEVDRMSSREEVYDQIDELIISIKEDIADNDLTMTQRWAITAYATHLREEGYIDLALRMLNLLFFNGEISTPRFYQKGISMTPSEKLPKLVDTLVKFLLKQAEIVGLKELIPLINVCSNELTKCGRLDLAYEFRVRMGEFRM